MILFEQRGAKNSNVSDDLFNTAQKLARDLRLPFPVARLLCARGITDFNDAAAFLSPAEDGLFDPYLFMDMDKAVERIVRAIECREKICIFGDYDVDGVCATSMLLMYLRFSGANVTYHIPSRQTEGYGMNSAAIESIAASGVTLIITVDNGITANAEVALAATLGVDIIITDHHKFLTEIPECVAVICHSRPDNTYPNTSLCGAGTALKLITALGGIGAAREYMAFAGLATVADVVPLMGENRVITALALNIMNSESIPLGLKALADVSGITNRRITSRDLGFAISPRLNASGRMGDASLAVELLCSRSYRHAIELAQRLNQLNEARRYEESVIFADAMDRISHMDMSKTRLIALKSEDWNPGIIGIAASKLCEKHYRPAILFSQNGDSISGSARSVPGINIYDVLLHFSDMFTRFGGHSYAAGVTMPVAVFDEFREKVNDYLAKSTSFTNYIPKKFFDFEIELSDVNRDLANSLELLAPFGEGNPSPSFLTRNIRIQMLKRMGNENAHLRGKIVKERTIQDIVAFDKGYMFDMLMDMDSYDVLYTPFENDWRGQPYLQLRVNEIKCSEITEPDRFFEIRSDKFTESFIDGLYCTRDFEDVDTVSSLERIDEAGLINELNSSCEGTLVFCFTQEGATEFVKLMRQHNIVADVYFGTPVEQRCAYNTVVVAPKIFASSALSRRYSRIVCYDCPQSIGLVDAMIHTCPKSKIVLPASDKYFSTTVSENEPYFLDSLERNCIGKTYIEATAVLGDRGMYIQDLIDVIAEKIGIDRGLCEFEIFVFSELGLLHIDEKYVVFAVMNAKKAELTDSRLYYTAINAEKNRSELKKLLFSVD